jgi:CRISPR-associated endonuclease/helicase Cas3
MDVAAVGTALVAADPRLSDILYQHPLFKNNPCFLPFLLALHDIGKFSKQFQDKIQNNLNNGASHTEPGLYILKDALLDTGVIHQMLTEKIGDSKEVKMITSHLQILIEPITGHHGKPVSKDALRGNLNLFDFGKQNLSDANRFIAEVFTLFLSELTVPKMSKEQTRILSWVLAGICVMADWLASNPENFPWKKDDIPLSGYWSQTVLRSEKILSHTGLVPSDVSHMNTTKELFGFSPRTLQACIDSMNVSRGPNLYIIEESTGGGKTEAALVLAHKLMTEGCGDGFYIALPTMATSNAMYERIAGNNGGVPFYEKIYAGNLPVSLVLAHGQTVLSKRYQAFLAKSRTVYPDAWIYDNNKKALLASVGVGTIDQVLMGVLPWKHQSLRILGCVRNILIIDEVHAYDSYMNSLLENLLSYHKSCGGSAILLSATIPKTLKKRLVSIYTDKAELPEISAYPLITQVNGSGEFSEIFVPPSPEKYVSVQLVHHVSDVIDRLVKTAEEGGCACWIRNTVMDAVEGYQILKEKTGVTVLLFHARFAMGDRLNRENEVLRLFGKSSSPDERRGRILVATQVVEQSLDLDFDFMVSDLAPIDLIIQRAGRLWRHERVRPAGIVSPEFLLLSPDPSDEVFEDWYSSMFERGGFVYPDHGKLWKTAWLLMDMGGFSMPKDARFLIDSVYSEKEGDIPASLHEHDRKAALERKISGAHADSVSLNFKRGYLDGDAWSSGEPALTREGEQTVLLELWKEEEGKEQLWFNGVEHGDFLSRVTVSARRIPAQVRNSMPEDSEAIRIVFRKDGLVWIPVDSVFKSSGVFYSEMEGLVFLK